MSALVMIVAGLVCLIYPLIRSSTGALRYYMGWWLVAYLAVFASGFGLLTYGVWSI